MICCLTVVTMTIVTSGWFGVILWGNVYSNMMNELNDDFDELVQREDIYFYVVFLTIFKAIF